MAGNKYVFSLFNNRFALLFDCHRKEGVYESTDTKKIIPCEQALRRDRIKLIFFW